MLRRDLLKNAAAVGVTAGVTPKIARAARSKSLVYVPTSDLTVLDPIVTFNRPTRNYGSWCSKRCMGWMDWQSTASDDRGTEGRG